MSIRNLDFLFKPRSIALIGASREPFSVGAVVARNLFDSGFKGPILPVDPSRRAVEGVLAYPDVAALPIVPDLAVIATPPDTVPSLVDSLGRIGTRAAVVITSAFDADGMAAGDALRRSMLQAAQPFTMRIIGPDCLGVMVPAIGLNTSVAPVTPKVGHLAFIARSGGVVATVLDWATTRGIGFSHFASLGDMSDVDFGDLLDYLAHEIDVRAIILYMEGITEARKFMSAARAASRLMPVIVIRCRSLQSLNDITLKPSQLTDDDLVFDAAFRRAGMLRVQEIGDLFGAVETLGTGRMANGDQLAILTNGGGVGALAADALIGHGGRLAKLSSNTHSALRNLLPKTSSVANPIDMTADVPASHYGKVLKLLLADRGVEAMLLLHAPTGIISPLDAARAVVSALGKSKACVLTCWLGETVPREARQLFAEYRVPTYDTPERAVRAFMHIITYRRNQEILMQTPASVPEVFKPDQGTSRRIIAEALEEGRRVLTDIEARSILEAYEIPVVRSVTVHDEYEAKQAAEQIGGKVTVEIKLHGNCSLDGMETVAANLDTPQQVADAVDRMRRAASKVYPGTQLEGVVVQESVDRPTAYELFVGIGDHPEFGPVILFGAGGPAWDIIDDIVVALPPLNMHLALDAIQRTRISWQLRGFRGRAPVALDALALTLVKISQLVVDFAEVTSLTINPLVVDQQGVIATMPTVGIARASVAPAKRLAIRPYPKELEELLSLPNGQAFLLRPVLPEDEPEFQSLFERLTPEDVRMRFFAPKKELMHPVAARMTQIDYDREMALVLATPGPAGRSPIFGAVHISADPDNETAEYAIMLQSDMSGMGLGPMLMRKIIDYSRKRGIKEIYGEVLRENRPMLKVCDLFHFSRSVRPDDPGTVEVRLKL